ncbi:reverse transcriptase-like protein [Microcoleus sp. MOSTC5]|uniref:RNase H family protein n=1 Tax=Microcoleus sp. MOSTC5 TaxID=3055378 RepID=UPI002FD2D272
MVAVQNSTETQTKPVVNIHCDGACSGNPGPGGWAAILTVPGKQTKKAISGKADTTTTNNRMELTAVIEGLKALKKPCTVTLFSDSTYVIHTMTKNWNRNANQDLWEELDKLAEVHDITWLWLSRNSTPELSECDRLAKEQVGNS